ncbi:tetratricopeptide repeat protein [Flavobacterium sp. ST-75]|uniref:Tetratricopeptide repeat protein n=1 Tax=Flavobacterium rhizophilum TaxID=3163296 RepID=A0ABW8YGP2_9FLAO
MRYLTSLLFLVFCLSANAQNYPKYKTTRVKDTVFTQPEKTDEIVIAETQLAEESKSEFEELLEKARQLYRDLDNEQAIDVLNQALAISPPDWEYVVLNFRGHCYFRLRDFDNAINDYTKALEETKIPHYNAKGQLCLARGIAYSARGGEGDKERKCADITVARATGALGGDRSILDEGCD